MIHYAAFVHKAEIRRKTHTITSGRKVAGEVQVAASVECHLEPVGDTASVSVIGRAAVLSWQGRFPTGTDVQVGDEVVWLDRTGWVFLVEGVQPRTVGRYEDDSIIEASLIRRET